MHSSAIALLVLLGVGSSAIAAAAPVGSCHAVSGVTTLPLVELYTSEGCSSCPPADRWLSKTFAPDATPAAAVLAFHVDYWDRLGWRDRFASAAYTERQYDAMRATHAKVVYTPQVLLQGRDRGMFGEAGGRQGLGAVSTTPPRAHITLDAHQETDGIVVDIDATSTAKGEPIVQVALTESGLSSEVRAGENAGVRLSHDHVVRVLAKGPAFDAQGRANGPVRLPLPKERGRDPTVVAFVQDRATGEVLQSVVLPVCAGS